MIRAAPAAGASRPRQVFTSAWLARRIRELIGSPLRGQQFCVAFSGGADSSALLAALAALRARHGLSVRAVHVNHHLQPAARAMARAAAASARRLGVRCAVIDAPVRIARGESPEAAARAVRYGALRGQLRSDEWLLLAHHQDDQLESLLLQLLRGAGVAGLAAMPDKAGATLRPMLPIARAELVAWLERRRVGWVEDPSNQDERHARNFLRLKIVPLLRERWPGIGVTLSRSAALAAEAQQLLEARADDALADAVDGVALRVTVLRRLRPAERRNALRRWLQLRGLPMPDQRRLLELTGPLLRARHDAHPFIRWPGARVSRQGDRLLATHEAPAEQAATII